MKPAVAIVGMACRYPDADSPEALWENVLAQRRAFRQIPQERLNLGDYGAADREAADRTYTTQAAVLEGYTFDRLRYRVSGDTFRSADMAHWLALDVAAQALTDAGFAEGAGLPRPTTGVLVGNTLTGEFSRANVMRLRWPYVRRVLDAALADEGWSGVQRLDFLETLESRYKAPFPEMGTETLAGGLSNTIAGRICNHFDLNGGGYTVDGACASSLLAVIQASTAVAARDLDVALAGGVDLSLDPFELVGFARVGALAERMMRVYDARSEGFWPGEGCGMVVLMRYEEAVRQGRRVYAVLRGWGISSDGSGGITRPEVDGQILAVRRAWRCAGYGVETAAFFEGHGTGTRVGDATELQMLRRARHEADPEVPPAAIGSVKANIGHTKAAAGVAGLLKATLALHHQIIPPATGCDTPHPELAGKQLALYAPHKGHRWPADRPLRAGVSAMGFGGINTHLALENPVPDRYGALTPEERRLLASSQDAELFLLGARSAVGLEAQIQRLLEWAPQISFAELADLAATLAASPDERQARAAVVASAPAELTARLQTLAAWLAEGEMRHLESGCYLGFGMEAPTIGFLFPGQASPVRLDGGVWRRRFASVEALYAEAALPASGEGMATEVAQPAIVTASMAALRVLDRLGIIAEVAVGHSLGELTALHWAGALDEAALRRLAAVRGRAMADLGDPTGTMASLAAGPAAVKALLDGTSVVIAGLNGPQQTVVSGSAEAVAEVMARAKARGIASRQLAVSHAFHSPFVAAAAVPLAEYMASHPLGLVQRAAVSTVTGRTFAPEDDLADILIQQVTSPVRFTEAIEQVEAEVDLWIEVGPGQVLSRLVASRTDMPVVATDAGSASLQPLLKAVGAAFVLGAPVRADALFADRFTRPFSLDHPFNFLANPCEYAPTSDPATRQQPQASFKVYSNGSSTNGHRADGLEESRSLAESPPESPLDLVRRLVAERTELPLASVRNEDRLLSDLHLNSITVSELVNEAARCLGLPPSAGPSHFADASLAELADVLARRAPLDSRATVAEQAPPGIEAWIRPFQVVFVEQERPPQRMAEGRGTWQVITPQGYPLRAGLEEAFGSAGGRGIVVAVPPGDVEPHAGLLVQAARAALAEKEPACLVIVQHGSGGAAALARTVHLEAPRVTACVVDVPIAHPEAAAWVRAEAQAATDYTEVVYDARGIRREPRLRVLALPDAPGDLPLGPDDVVLITGGGKGITAACALALGQASGACLVLLGRSHPDADAELKDTLHRLTEASVTYRYFAVDVTDANAVRLAVKEAEAALGPITAVLHGAARNVPKPLATLTEDDIHKTYAPKVIGLRNVLAAIDPERLRVLITFGSIIGRMGLPGEADYALANAALVEETERWRREHPQGHCLAIEWSVWSAVGMGARLGSIEALTARGVIPIPPDEGTALMLRLLAHPPPDAAVVVAGRWGALPTLPLAQPELPLRRFLETPRVVYPGVELVVDSHLSSDTDPYLDDHVLQGERLLPAVLGLEAMTQAAQAVLGSEAVPVFEAIEFKRPVVVPGQGGVRIRIAALVRAPGLVDVVLRSEQTGFQADHFRAICRFETPAPVPKLEIMDGDALMNLAPERDLYGRILFHRGRFRRLSGYRKLHATACLAEIAPDEETRWFGRYLPGRLVLGDPGARDAAIHAVQACIPHAPLVPVGVERLTMYAAAHTGPRFVEAWEQAVHDGTFVYDLHVTDADGQVLEHWEGLRLRPVGAEHKVSSWPAPLLGPYLERRLHGLIPETSFSVTVVRDTEATQRVRSDHGLQHLLGLHDTPLQRQRNGKPKAVDGRSLSAAHAGHLTLAVAGAGLLGCDIEPVRSRPEAIWYDLLGVDGEALARLLVKEAGDDYDTAATRVWTVLESMKKAGLPVGTPLVLDAVPGGGWVILASGRSVATSFVTSVSEESEVLALAVWLTPESSPQSALVL